jgi:hypothetical protein
MPAIAPLTAAGSREPRQRQRPLPPKIRAVCDLMVFGRQDDENCAPLSFIDAAKECGVAPDIMRRWLDRGQARKYLLGQRRLFRAAICSGNELALLDIRQNAANSMARIAAVRTLEQLEAEADAPNRNPDREMPGITIRILPASPPMRDVTPAAPNTIDIVPSR